jgi:hypothetical protein
LDRFGFDLEDKATRDAVKSLGLERKAIDIHPLRKDRIRLLGEAAKYESVCENITHDEKLWPAAGGRRNDEPRKRRGRTLRQTSAARRSSLRAFAGGGKGIPAPPGQLMRAGLPVRIVDLLSF